MAHAGAGHGLVALLHLVHSPLQGVLGQVHVRDHGVHEVRQGTVDRQFDALGVHEQEFHVLGGVAVDQTQEQAVQAHGLARARGAGHEQVGHLGQVGDAGDALDVLAQGQGQLGLGFGEGRVFDDLAQVDGLALLVGDFYAHGIAARQGRDDAHGPGLEGQGEIVAHAGDAADLDARCGLVFEHGDDGTRLHSLDLALDAEIGEAGRQGLGLPVEHGFGNGDARSRNGCQKLDGREARPGRFESGGG